MATLPAGAAILLEFIRKTETRHTGAVAYDTIYGHNQNKLPKPLTKMTVNEVIAAGPGWTKAYKSSAAGAYQFMNATLKDLKAAEGLTGGETFTPALQDRLGLSLLKRRGFAGFMAGTVGLHAFGLGLAREWASFPVLTGVKGAHRAVARGETYYAGDRLNKALVKPEAVEAVLTKVKVAAGSAPAIPPTSAPPKRKTLVDLLKGWFVKKATDQIAHQLKDTPIMNSNFLHNILNIAIAIVAVISLPEVVAILPPELGLMLAGVAAGLKTVINVARDGFGGLFKEQPPVR